VAAIGIALVGAALAFSTSCAFGAVMNRASAERRGQALEMHFKFRGGNLRWHISTHSEELRIDLDNTRMELPPRPLFGQEAAPVKAVRALELGHDKSRLVIEVSGKTDYAIARLPHELVIRVASAGVVPDLAAPILVRMEKTHSQPGVAPVREARIETRKAPAYLVPPSPAYRSRSRPPPKLSSRPAHAQSRAFSRHWLVMIDPGHGGYDPGTEVDPGLPEKTVALEISRKLKQALEERGIDARLTRDGDYFLSLADRTRLANRAHADLFISIHLNSSPDPQTAGIETYYLDNTTDRATIRLARMENGAGGRYSAAGQPNLNYILTDMRQQYKAIESASLARMTEAQAVADLDASFGLRVGDLGARKGPFYVLVGAQMPAVLAECGFLSNPAEAHLLASARYQQVLAEAIAAALVHYFRADAAVGNL
jgi:N-acetylmuramoyl-L-alanine amidase